MPSDSENQKYSRIVHITEIEELYPLVKEVPESVKRLTEKYWPGPLTVILPKSDIIPPQSGDC